jgi:hypothetical protein
MRHITDEEWNEKWVARFHYTIQRLGELGEESMGEMITNLYGIAERSPQLKTNIVVATRHIIRGTGVEHIMASRSRLPPQVLDVINDIGMEHFYRAEAEYEQDDMLQFLNMRKDKHTHWHNDSVEYEIIVSPLNKTQYATRAMTRIVNRLTKWWKMGAWNGTMDDIRNIHVNLTSVTIKARDDY